MFRNLLIYILFLWPTCGVTAGGPVLLCHCGSGEGCPEQLLWLLHSLRRSLWWRWVSFRTAAGEVIKLPSRSHAYQLPSENNLISYALTEIVMMRRITSVQNSPFMPFSLCTSVSCEFGYHKTTSVRRFSTMTRWYFFSGRAKGQITAHGIKGAATLNVWSPFQIMPFIFLWWNPNQFHTIWICLGPPKSFFLYVIKEKTFP